VTPTAAERQAAAWVAGLFLMIVLLQRFSVPGLPAIALLVPAVLVWTAAARVWGVVVVDATRMIWWLTVAFVTGALILIQARWLEASQISVRAWALMLVVWLPFVVRLSERGVPAYMTLLRHITTITTALGAASIAMIGIQLAGVRFEDWFGQIVPTYLQLGEFNTTYPIQFGSSIYKSNAFIGLEPSIISALLGVGLLAAILTSARAWIIVVLVAGMVATVAGSGMIIVLVGILVMMLARRSRRVVSTYAAVFLLLGVAAYFTKFGRLVFERAGEFQSDNSSTNLRLFEPYRVLFPEWSTGGAGALLGYGPGSSQRAALDAVGEGVLVTTPVKIFFEYGLFGGLVLASFVFFCFWGGPSRTFAISLLVSTWLLQAGLASVIITLPILMTVTLWSPRIGATIEAHRSAMRLPSGLLRRRADSIESSCAPSKFG
jgi:hypothetical protein